jgi:CRISPR-associated protein Cst2
VTFNAASPGATPSASKGDKSAKNPVPYGTELHATRYQYGFALTPESLQRKERAAVALKCLGALGEVAGNHGRFLFDFSPESAIFRVTDDPAPRLLYIFENAGGQADVDAPKLITRMKSGDLPANEIIICGGFAESETARQAAALGATVIPGVRRGVDEVARRIH